MPDPMIRKHQEWAGRAEPSRRFLVLDVSDDTVRGWEYRVHQSTTRTKTMPELVFREVFTLLEESPFPVEEAPDVAA